MVEPTFLFFWDHAPAPDGRIGRECLSQWWPAPFTVEDRTYPTAEHWMMWRKAVLFDDGRVAAAVLDAPDPAHAKALGREVAHFDSARWASERLQVVVDGSIAKFAAHPDLRDYLLGTGDRVLVEASPDDAVWGIGIAAAHPDAAHPDRWPAPTCSVWPSCGPGSTCAPAGSPPGPTLAANDCRGRRAWRALRATTRGRAETWSRTTRSAGCSRCRTVSSRSR